MTTRGATSSVAGIFLLVAACGGEVNLGTIGDAGDPSVSAPCEPCGATTACATGLACVELGGELFCASRCSLSHGCGPEEHCEAAPAGSEMLAMVCLPHGDACFAPSPLAPDSGLPERCGARVGPSVAATCTACKSTSRACQPNGCYGGYWCNTEVRACERPPRACP